MTVIRLTEKHLSIIAAVADGTTSRSDLLMRLGIHHGFDAMDDAIQVLTDHGILGETLGLQLYVKAPTAR